MITAKRKQTIRGPGGLTLQLDSDQIFPDNPGMGTPCLLEIGQCKFTGTFNCAMNEGEVDGIRLTENQMHWINELEYPVYTWLTNWTKQIEKENEE